MRGWATDATRPKLRRQDIGRCRPKPTHSPPTFCDDPWGWIAAGRAYERFGLAATLEGLQHAFVNQVVEVATARVALQSILGLGTLRADLIGRFGHGPEMPRSLRRPVKEVLIS